MSFIDLTVNVVGILALGTLLAYAFVGMI